MLDLTSINFVSYLDAITFAQEPVLRQSCADLRKRMAAYIGFPAIIVREPVKLHVLVYGSMPNHVFVGVSKNRSTPKWKTLLEIIQK